MARKKAEEPIVAAAAVEVPEAVTPETESSPFVEPEKNVLKKSVPKSLISKAELPLRSKPIMTRSVVVKHAEPNKEYKIEKVIKGMDCKYYVVEGSLYVSLLDERNFKLIY